MLCCPVLGVHARFKCSAVGCGGGRAIMPGAAEERVLAPENLMKQGLEKVATWFFFRKFNVLAYFLLIMAERNIFHISK